MIHSVLDRLSDPKHVWEPFRCSCGNSFHDLKKFQKVSCVALGILLGIFLTLGLGIVVFFITAAAFKAALGILLGIFPSLGLGIMVFFIAAAVFKTKNSKKEYNIASLQASGRHSRKIRRTIT